MSLLLYAITDGADAAVVESRGVDDAPVQLIRAAGLTAAVSRHEASLPLTEETVWAFERVIESLMGTGAVLPARFGTMLADTDELEHTLAARRSALLATLDRVRGAVELSVRGHWSDTEASAAPPPEGRTGTDYMRARAEPQRRADALAAQMRAHLDGHAREARHRTLSRTSEPVTAAFLVDRAEQAAFLTAVRRLEAELSDTELVCTGPWPAYSFVGETADA